MPSATDSNALSQEWTTLQNNHEQYEKNALWTKIAALVLFALCWVMLVDSLTVSLVLLVIWVQESIYRTSQARLAVRILRIEEMFRVSNPATGLPFQLHSEWLATRPGFAGLLAEYAANAKRPTVAFPYVVLLLMQWVLDRAG
jgi:hypothetical protein